MRGWHNILTSVGFEGKVPRIIVFGSWSMICIACPVFRLPLWGQTKWLEVVFMVEGEGDRKSETHLATRTAYKSALHITQIIHSLCSVCILSHWGTEFNGPPGCCVQGNACQDAGVWSPCRFDYFALALAAVPIPISSPVSWFLCWCGIPSHLSFANSRVD